MSLITKRQLPNVNSEKIRQFNSVNTENYAQPAQKIFLPYKQTTSLGDETTYPRLHRHSQEIKPNREEHQRKLVTSIHNEEDNIPQTRTKSNPQILDYQLPNTKRQLEENESNKNLSTHQDSATIRESAKSIRENVTQFKNQLIRNDVEYKKPIQKEEELSSLLNRQRRTGQDHLQLENEYLIHQQTMLSKSATLNEMLSFKKELEKSERQREQLSNQLESVIKTSDEKDKVVSKTLMEFKEMTENCDTFERQNTKLQHDLTLALEKLEEMTEEAERFAYESLNSQKQLADSEQKREEFQIQAQETTKQWNARVKKLEKDIDRYKLDSTQMLEKNEQLMKEIETFKSQNFTLKEQNTKIETDFNEANRNYKRLEEQFQQNEKNIVQLRTIHSSQEGEIATLKGTLNELQSQLSNQRHRFSQADKEKQYLQESLQEEIKHRNNLHSKLKQTQHDIETANTSNSQLQNERMNFLQKLKEIQLEKENLLNEKTKFLSLENDYEEIQQKLERTKIDYTRGMKALQTDYENKIETFELQLSNEKSENTILRRHELELKKQIEKLLEKLTKYEDEHTEGQCTIETLSTEINDKSRVIDEYESKITKLTVEITNQKNEMIRKDKEYQNSLHIVYEDMIDCTECLSNDSNKPFIIEPATTPRDHLELWSSQMKIIKAHLAWLKQELEIRQEEENQLREDLKNALLDCETDRQHFASELAKREIMINELTNHRPTFERQSSDTINEYDRQQTFTESDRDRMDHRYRQFQIMIDSVKRELHTAKVQLLA